MRFASCLTRSFGRVRRFWEAEVSYQYCHRMSSQSSSVIVGDFSETDSFAKISLTRFIGWYVLCTPHLCAPCVVAADRVCTSQWHHQRGVWSAFGHVIQFWVTLATLCSCCLGCELGIPPDANPSSNWGESMLCSNGWRSSDWQSRRAVAQRNEPWLARLPPRARACDRVLAVEILVFVQWFAAIDSARTADYTSLKTAAVSARVRQAI